MPMRAQRVVLALERGRGRGVDAEDTGVAPIVRECSSVAG